MINVNFIYFLEITYFDWFIRYYGKIWYHRNLEIFKKDYVKYIGVSPDSKLVPVDISENAA